MIKLIASDIDGTLVKDGTLAIDREYMEVIGRLIDKGIVFVACSGRQYRSERKLFAPVADRLLYISDGGTVVRTGLRHLREIKITINRRNAGFFMSNFIYFYVVRSCILSLYVI